MLAGLAARRAAGAPSPCWCSSCSSPPACRCSPAAAAASACSPAPSAGFLLGWVAGAFVAGLLAGCGRRASPWLAAGRERGRRHRGGLRHRRPGAGVACGPAARASVLATRWVFLPGRPPQGGRRRGRRGRRSSAAYPLRERARRAGGRRGPTPAPCCAALAARAPGEPALAHGCAAGSPSPTLLGAVGRRAAAPTGRSARRRAAGRPASPSSRHLVAAPASRAHAPRGGAGHRCRRRRRLAVRSRRARTARGRARPLLALPTSGTTSAPRGPCSGRPRPGTPPRRVHRARGHRPGRRRLGARAPPSSTLTLLGALARARDRRPGARDRAAGAGSRRAGGVAVLDAATVLHAVPAVLADVLAARAAGRLSRRCAGGRGRCRAPAGAARRAPDGRRRRSSSTTAPRSSRSSRPDPATAPACVPFPGAEVRVRDGLDRGALPLPRARLRVTAGADGPLVPDGDGWAGVGDRGADRCGRRPDGRRAAATKRSRSAATSCCSRTSSACSAPCRRRARGRLRRPSPTRGSGSGRGRGPLDRPAADAGPWSDACGRGAGGPAGTARALRGTRWSTTCRGRPRASRDPGRLDELLDEGQVSEVGRRAARVGPTARRARLT